MADDEVTQTTQVIDEQDLKDIREIFSGYQEKVAQMGTIQFERLSIQERLDELVAQETVLVKERSELADKEEELTKTLNSKYGEGTLDINTGEFKSN